jgi:Stress responsive A/B Barrel Domain
MNPAKILEDWVITAPDYRPGLLRHIVLFQYAEATTPEQRQELEERFHALSKSKRQGKRYIASIESGVQNSPEGLHRDLERGFIVTFESEGDRNYYLGEPFITNPACYDPAHHEFKRFAGQYLSLKGVLVFDFTVRKKSDHDAPAADEGKS